MSKDGLRAIKAGCIAAATLAAVTFGMTMISHADNECLVEFQTNSNNTTSALKDNDHLCAVASGKTCTFQLGVCVNTTEAGCTNLNLKGKKIKAKGKGCGKIGKVSVSPSGTSSTCGAFTGVTVKTKKKGTVAGTCVAKVKVKSDKASGKMPDEDTVTLDCMPSTATCPTTSTTTTTPVTTTTTTTAPQACNGCAAEEIVTVSSAGTLQVSTLPAFPFPANVMTTIDTGPAGLGCVHDAIVPANGFFVPVFCIPALQFTSAVYPTGCESGGSLGSGKVWDANDPAHAGPSPDINRLGDTSDASTGGQTCGTLGSGCTTAVGAAGGDTLGNIDTTRGGNVNGVAGVHTQVDIPVHSITWVAADSSCPDSDGTFNAGTDTPVTDFNFILSPTTGHSSATYSDLNGDSCKRAGNGPDTQTADGIPATGPCCTVGQATTVSATGIAFTGGAPLYDITFKSITPTTISACNAAPTLGTCVLTTDPCQD
jgi:hypothetical protein